MRILTAAAALIVLAGCRTTPRSVRIDPALDTLVPADAVLLAGIRVDRLRDTVAWEKFANRPMPFLDDAARETGLDLRDDLWEVLLVSDGSHAVAFGRGKFGETGLEPRASVKAERLSYHGVIVAGPAEASIAFLTASTVVAGPRESVQWAIDQRDRATGPSRPLVALVQQIPPANQIWAAGIGGTSPALKGNAGNVARALSMSESAWAAVQVDADARLAAELTGRSEEEAKQLQDALGALAALARITTRDRELARALENLQIQRRDRTVTVNAVLTAAQLEKLLP